MLVLMVSYVHTVSMCLCLIYYVYLTSDGVSPYSERFSSQPIVRWSIFVECGGDKSYSQSISVLEVKTCKERGGGLLRGLRVS